MSQHSDPINQLWRGFIGLILLLALLPVGMSVIIALVRMAIQAVLDVLGGLFSGLVGIGLVVLGVFVVAGLLVRLGRSAQTYWAGILRAFHGRPDGRRRVRGAEHLAPPRRRRRRVHRDDPDLPVGGPQS